MISFQVNKCAGTREINKCHKYFYIGKLDSYNCYSFGMSCVSFFLILLLSCPVLVHSVEEMKFNPNCLPFDCGKLGKLRFPFSKATCPECGVFRVNCSEPVQKIQLERGGRWYEIEDISQDNTVTINDTGLLKRLQSQSCESFNYLTLPRLPFVSFLIMPNISLFKCNHSLSIPLPKHFSSKTCGDYDIYYSLSNDTSPSLQRQCSVIQLPIQKSHSHIHDLFTLLTATFSIEMLPDPNCYDCYKKGGKCQNNSDGKFQCSIAKGDDKLKLKLGLGASVAGIAIIVVLCCCFWGIFASNKSMVFWKKNSRKYADVEAFIRNYGFLAPKRYSYSSTKKITNSFQDKLGQGGYGSVYKGKLQDGKVVAVKVLNNPKSNGEEFINEVASISRTSHVNIVALSGFCFEGSKRALIYEFMPNGSLEKFIYDKKSSISDRQLGWKSLYQISLGIARGLEYLHRGCKTRIVHFDIKPHNILLDEDFCPKISDFGLSKLCPRKDSIISMTGARGTPGYIAPEVFCRNFGEVSHKSDVYSYGMMVLEMVGGRKNIDVGVDRTSEIYFPHLIYRRLELHDELGLQGIANEEDKEFARKMIIVSLWCIQSDPSSRPPISEVVDMLEGSPESLKFPPKPYLSSPSRSPPDSSTTNGIITL